MGSAATLQDVMNAVSRQIDLAASVPVSTVGMDEMEAFAMLDPLLADLTKQYRDARHTRLQAEKEYGRDDAMTEMAMDMEDSAWCAVQTRYMEVREMRAMMANAQALMEEARLEEIAQAKKKKEREALDRFREIEMLARMQEKKGGYTGADLWLAIILLFNRDWGTFRFEHPTYSFNRIAA